MSRPSLLDVSVEPVSATSDEDSSRRGSTRKATPMDRKRTSSANRRSRDKSAEHRQNQSTQNNSEIGDDTGNNTGVISAPTTEKKTPPSTHSDNDEKKGEEVDTAAQDNDNNNNNETPAAKVDSNEDENKKEKKGEEEELEISPMDSEKTNSTKVSSISDKDKKRKRKEPKAQEGEDNKEKHDDGEERQKGSRRSSADKRKDEEATKATDKEEENKKVDENAVDSQLEGKTNERDTTAAGEQPPADTEGLDTRDTEEDDKNNKENIEEAAAPEGVTADDGVKPDDDGAVAQETAEGNDKTKNDNEAVPEVTVGDDENKHDEAAPASQVGADDNSNKQDDNETAPKVPAGEENNDGAPVSGAEADDNNKNAGDGEATAPEGTAGGNTVKPGDEGKETTTAPEANHKNTEEPTDAQPNAEVPTADGSKQSEDAVPVEDTHQGQDALFAPEKATTPLPVTSHHTKVFEGDDWGALLVHQPAALKEAFLLDITCACDLRRSQIQSTTFALGSLIASFTVDHDDHTMTSGEMEAVLLTYDFPHVMALYKRQKEEEERSTLLLDVTEPVPEDPSIAERLEQQRSALSLSMEATAEDLALAQQLKDRAKELRVKELQRQLRNVELDEEVEREAIEGMEAVVRTQWDHTKRAVGQHQLQQSLLEEELEGAAEDAKLKARLLQQRRAQLQLDEEQARALQENEELSARTNIIVRERMGRVAAAAEEADRLQEERNCLRQQREAVRLLQELVLEEPQRRQRLRRQEAHAREVIGLEADSDKATLLLLENDAARRAASVAAEQGRQARWRQGLLQLEDLLSEEEEGRFTLKEAERDGRRALRALHTHTSCLTSPCRSRPC
ncbi:hypothetical protein, conserved [Angomonas deanei]|uniref:Flagellar attachment zone protein 1 conserved domain-containing protein n=1 Tax=Angomonas deanei TaxID=59799 RepID=A0A7G2CDM1_9TRYP|nr:hypothetical protein, conserved [Angomonas deanei]